MSAWLLAPLAFVTMMANDMLGVLLVQAEASYRAHRAALCDMAQDACQLACLGALGGAALDGGRLVLTVTSVAVIGARLLADYAGTYAGVRLGQRLDRRAP